MSEFLGFESPNHTQAPNEFYDVLLPQIDTLAELKVTELVIRNTMGWHRRGARMSLSFFERGTGLTRPAVIAGLRAALNRGTITRDARTQMIVLRFRAGSKADLLPTSKNSLPKPVKSFYSRNKKEISNSIKERGYARVPAIVGKLARREESK